MSLLKQKTQIIYKGKKPNITELQELMPHLDITLSPLKNGTIPTVIDPIYKTRTIDWTWFRKQFAPDNDVNALVLEKGDLSEIGIKDHWGFYSLDEDMKHHFYLTNLGSYLSPRAKNNGFKHSFTWMFCHEYLHGAVWGNTRNRNLSASIVHKWQKEGILKSKIEEDVELYNTKISTINILEKIVGLFKQIISKTVITSTLPLVERKTQEVLEEMNSLGHPMRIVQGFRSIDEQNKLYAQGRTMKGLKVTNAKGGNSFHNYGVAVDLTFQKEGYNASNALWKKFGTVAKKHGFEWGGDWKNFIDKPHLEMTMGYSINDFKNQMIDYSRFK